MKNGRPTDGRRFLNVMNEGSCKTETGQKMEPLPFHSKQNNMQVTWWFLASDGSEIQVSVGQLKHHLKCMLPTFSYFNKVLWICGMWVCYIPVHIRHYWDGSPFAQNFFAPDAVRPGSVHPSVLFVQGPFAHRSCSYRVRSSLFYVWTIYYGL